MNNVLAILSSPDWENKLIEHFKANFENTLKDVLDKRLGESNYFINLVLYSFTQNKLFPVFKLDNNIGDQIFNDRYDQLKKFSFSDKMVKYDTEKPIFFCQVDKNCVSKWDNYFPSKITNDSDFSERDKSHKIWIEEIIDQRNILQISFIPILTGSGTKKVGGVFALNSTREIEFSSLLVLQRILSGIISPLPIQELEHLNLQANRKAAISQVMDRQMSHNINSHVMAKLVNTDEQFDPKDIKSFLRYLQSRIEFIADIVTSEPLVTFPAKLKEDVIEHFIGKNDNQESWPKYIIKYISGTSELTINEYSRNIIVSFNFENDITVALPNDLLGAHAFYVILENIIRNSAKHSVIPTDDASNKKLLQLTVDIDSNYENPDYYKLVIRDNLGSSNSEYRNRRDFGAEKNLSFDAWMNAKIDRNILDDLGKLRENDWGLLEMKICAAYLRKYPLNDLDNKSASPRLFNIVLDNVKNMGYELYLLKPKLACIVVNNTFNYSSNDLSALIKSGIHTVKRDDIENLDSFLKYGTLKIKNEAEHKVSHNFLILETYTLEKIKVNSNQTVLEMNKSQIKTLLKSSNPELEILKILLPESERKSIRILNDEDCIPGIVINCNHQTVSEDEIIFHRHGTNHLRNNLDKYPPNLFYYEPYGTQSATQKIAENPYVSDVDNILFYEANLAAKLQVGILDERIQSEGCKEHGRGRVILDRMKVYMPDEQDIDLNKNNFHEKFEEGLPKKNIASKINDWLLTQKFICDYIVMHQGIIEKTLGTTDVEIIKNFIVDFYTPENGNGVKAELIIISGRGKPSNLPKDVFYLPFSLVNQYVITYRSKIYLYKLLKSARRYHG